MRTFRAVPSGQEVSDEELMRQLAEGRQEALGLLYSRYAPLVFNLSAQTLDRATAEEIVQEVFLTVWRQAATFAPERGSFRPWVLQIAHYRILNELRRQSRRPRAAVDLEELKPLDLADSDPEPAEAAWEEYRREALRAAFEELPLAQRQALGLAFFEELSHAQVAAVLNLPLGTVKTRIRAGLEKLRGKLAPLVAVFALLLLTGLLVLLGLRYQDEQAARQREQREQRALAMVTASDVTALHLAPAPGLPAETHGSYRSRPAVPLAVLTLSHFRPAPAGQTYQAWVRHNGRWTALGSAQPDANGSALLIAEGPELATPPEAIQVTVEPANGSPNPSGPVVVAWSNI